MFIGQWLANLGMRETFAEKGAEGSEKRGMGGEMRRSTEMRSEGGEMSET